MSRVRANPAADTFDLVAAQTEPIPPAVAQRLAKVFKNK